MQQVKVMGKIAIYLSFQWFNLFHFIPIQLIFNECLQFLEPKLDMHGCKDIKESMPSSCSKQRGKKNIDNKYTKGQTVVSAKIYKV